MEPPGEQAGERTTAQPMEYCENVDFPDHCCKACRDSHDRSDDDDISTRDDGCLAHEFLANHPTKMAGRVAKKFWVLSPRTAKPLGKL
eukprot:3595350-Pyramimonas_sp.AAC.1